MISDTLSDASHEITRYLDMRGHDNNPIYDGEGRQVILELQAHMDDIRIKLDCGEL